MTASAAQASNFLISPTISQTYRDGYPEIRYALTATQINGDRSLWLSSSALLALIKAELTARDVNREWLSVLYLWFKGT